jgi:hypothetical protein
MCFVAQRKRVRPITGRSEDRNLPKQIQALAQLVERSTVEVYKHRTAAGSIPASLKQPLFSRSFSVARKSGTKSIGGFCYTLRKCIWSYSEIVSRLLLSKKNWGRTSYDHPFWTGVLLHFF